LYNLIIANTTDLVSNYSLLQPLNKLKREVTPGMVFNQETLGLGSQRTTNLYWIELDKTRFKFKLETTIYPKPLLDFDLAGKRALSSVNFGSFFLSDDLTIPQVPFYNLLVNEGTAYQFPSNNRPALWTRDGKIHVRNISAAGKIMIGNKTFTWSGSSVKIESDITAFGMFDINIRKSVGAFSESQRKIDDASRFVSCEQNEILLGVSIVRDESKVDIISKKPLDLTQFAYILRGGKEKLVDCKLGEKIKLSKLDGKNILKSDDVCSASFSLGSTKNELIKNLKQQLIYPQDSQPKPMANNYLKSWSVVLETSENLIFFINDARPQINYQSGMSVFELQDVLRKKFDYLWGCVGDSGQSSKLMIKNGDIREIYGNMHYQNLKTQPPAWDGLKGRPIPAALLVYE